MREIEKVVVIFWFAVVVLAVLAIYHFRALIEASAPIFAAIISAAALILGGILTHHVTELRAQDSERRERMQDNYKRVLEKLAPLIRDAKASDEFMTVHLETCIVGSSEVIESMETLITVAKSGLPSKELERLLLAMRNDLGLSDVSMQTGILFGKQNSNYLR